MNSSHELAKRLLILEDKPISIVLISPHDSTVSSIQDEIFLMLYGPGVANQPYIEMRVYVDNPVARGN